MKQSVRPAPSRTFYLAVYLIFALSNFVHAQDSQFLFDGNGNLLVQTAEASAPPQIIGQPQNRVVVPGETASFFVVAANTRLLTYQWRFNGTNIGGLTNDALLLQNVSTNHEGEYRVVLTNPSGSVTSAPALLMIDSDADGLPDSWERTYFSNLNQNATADFDGDGVANLTEFLDGTNPTNSASALFRLTVLTDGGVIELTPTQLSYTNGATVTLTATAFSPDIFHAWTGDTNTRSNPLTLTMNANKTVLAHFFPIDFVWTNLAGGDWNVASNWNPNLVPAAIDNAIITNNNLTVTLDSAGECLGLTLGDSSPPPTLTGNGTLTLHGASTWGAGTMSGSGRTVVETNASLNVANPNGIFLSTRTLENGGTVLWTGAGNINMISGAVITNRVGALFQVQNVGTFNTFSGVNRFDNAGTFRKSANNGTLTIPSGVNFNNSGTVELQSGTLLCNDGFINNGAVNLSTGTTNSLTAGGSGAGTFTAPAAALVEWTGGFTLNAGAQLNGAGLYRTSVGTFTANANLVVQNLDLPNGTLNGAGNLTIANAMNWTAGTMSGTGRTIMGAGATLTIPSPNALNLTGRTLENGGTVLWTGAGNINLNAAVITNRVGGLFHVQNAVPLFGFGTGCRFDNAGTFRKSANTGTTILLSIPFNNYGTVDIRSGILSATGGYASGSGALLNFALGGTTAGTGYGQLQVGGTVTLNGALSVDLLPGFSPATNNAFTVVTASTRSGAFANFFYPSNAATMQLSNTANSVVVRVTDVFSVPQPAPLPAGVISWWRAEGNALDSVGTNHGVLTNGATFAAGNVGQTFAFDGVNDYLSVADSPSLKPASVTIETWVKFFATNGIRIVLVKPLGINTTFDSYGLALQDGAVLAAICDNSGFGPFLTGPANIVPGQWYHLAYTFNDANKQQTLYVNGVAAASGTANKTIAYDTNPVLLGADLENGVLGFFHNGLIDEASIYSRALTSDEIATIYNAGAAGKQFFAALPLLLPPEISGTDFKLTWTAFSNTTYRLEYISDIGTTNWTGLPGDITTFSNTASKLDALTSSNRFYRVRVVP